MLQLGLCEPQMQHVQEQVDEEQNAVPIIKCQKWTEVPYKCKDGRELKNHDFVPHEVEIGDYIRMLETDPKQLLDFLPHRNRAKFLENGWKLVFDNVSRVGENLHLDEDCGVNNLVGL